MSKSKSNGVAVLEVAPVAVKRKSKMVWPAQKALQLALLLEINKRGGQVVLKADFKSLLKDLADQFGLSRNQRKLPHPTAKTKWSNKVQWAKLGLVQLGYLDNNGPRGTWTIDKSIQELIFEVESRKAA